MPVPALVLLCVLNHLAMVGARVAVALQALALGAPAWTVGALLAAFALLPLVFSVPTGRWIDRRGTRRPAAAGMAASALGLAAAALWPSAPVLFAAALGVGGGYSLASLALQHRLGARPEPARTAAFRWFAAGTALSIGGGPFIAGHAFERGGAALAFGLLAALPPLALLCGGGWWQRGPAARDEAAGHDAAAVMPDGVPRRALLWRLLAVDLLMALGWTANGLLVPLLAAAQGWPGGTVGDLGAAFGIGVGLVRLAGLRWAPAGRDWLMLRVSLAASAVCYAALPPAALWAGPAAAAAVQLLLGAALGLALPSVLALLVHHAPGARRAEALGLRATLLNASGLGMPLLLSLGAAAGVAPLAWVVGAGLLAGVPLARGGTRRNGVVDALRAPWRSLTRARCPRP
jgi:MFS family permease